MYLDLHCTKDDSLLVQGRLCEQAGYLPLAEGQVHSCWQHPHSILTMPQSCFPSVAVCCALRHQTYQIHLRSVITVVLTANSCAQDNNAEADSQDCRWKTCPAHSNFLMMLMLHKLGDMHTFCTCCLYVQKHTSVCWVHHAGTMARPVMIYIIMTSSFSTELGLLHN